MSSYNVIHEPNAVPIKAWTQGVPVEPEALEQVKKAARLPFIFRHLALMPDVHKGIGSTVGSVIPTKGAIIPAAVGVDIGCGMGALRLSLTANDLPDNLHAVRSAIEAAVPHGRTNNGGFGDRGAWRDLPLAVTTSIEASGIGYRFAALAEKHPTVAKGNVWNHCGTLGTGNHFIELCLDESGNVWVMLHSGSRGVGNRIGSYFIERAKEDMRRFFINLPDQDLAYLPEGSKNFIDYVEAVEWAQDFARVNRLTMMALIVASLRTVLPPFEIYYEEAINCHHNYVEREHHFGENVLVTRKGAVRARQGDMGIIPGSMGAKSYIVRGLGNPESFHSCSHGAGRVMSRTKAKATFTIDDQIKATEGVECRKDKDVIDEIPMAYKSIDAVMEAQRDATTRERLFIIARRKGHGKNSKIIWPEATHAPAAKVNQLFGEMKPWRSAREIIDWNLKGQSIFARKNPLAPATIKRIEAGLRKFGGQSAEPFIVVLRQHMAAQSVEEPLPTITAGGQHVALCEPFILGQQSGSVARSIDQPIPTVATDGAISLVEPFIVSTNWNETNRSSARSVEDPIPTVIGHSTLGLVEPFIVPQFGESQPKSVEDPLGTITTTSRGIGLCEPHLVAVEPKQIDPFLIVNRTNNTAKSLDEPVPTLCTGNHVAMVEPFLVNIDHTGSNGGQVMSTDRPLPTQTTKARTALVEPYLVRFQGNREKDLERNQSLDQPLGTLDTSNRYGVVEPFLVTVNHGEGDARRAHPVDEPLRTLTTKNGTALIEPYLVGYNGTSGPQSVDDPLATVTTRDRFGLVMPQIEIEGQRYYVDIRFRMLQPHELAAAMGFPEGYKFTGNKGDVVKQIGNAVPGNLSEALCKSLIAEAA